MAFLLQLLSLPFSIVSLVCFVLVVIQMFKRDNSTMGIVSLVLVPCCGIGFLVAFVFGWTKVTEWDLKKVMVAWTIAWAVGFVLGLGAAVLSPAIPAGQSGMNFDPENMEVNIDMEGTNFDMESGGFGTSEDASE